MKRTSHGILGKPPANNPNDMLFYLVQNGDKRSIKFGLSEDEVEEMPLTIGNLEICKRRIWEVDPSMRIHIPDNVKDLCK